MTWACSCGGKNKSLHRWCGKCWKERPAEATDKHKKDKKEKERDASQSNKPPWVKEKEERAAGGQEQGDRPSRSQSRGRLLKDLQNASASSDLPEHLRQKSQDLAREMKQQEDDSRPLHEQIVRLQHSLMDMRKEEADAWGAAEKMRSKAIKMSEKVNERAECLDGLLRRQAAKMEEERLNQKPSFGDGAYAYFPRGSAPPFVPQQPQHVPQVVQPPPGVFQFGPAAPTTPTSPASTAADTSAQQEAFKQETQKGMEYMFGRMATEIRGAFESQAQAQAKAAQEAAARTDEKLAQMVTMINDGANRRIVSSDDEDLGATPRRRKSKSRRRSKSPSASPPRGRSKSRTPGTARGISSARGAFPMRGGIKEVAAEVAAKAAQAQMAPGAAGFPQPAPGHAQP